VLSVVAISLSLGQVSSATRLSSPRQTTQRFEPRNPSPADN
jgi:hypothetical protein